MDISNVSEDYPAVYYAIVLIITLVAIKLIQSSKKMISLTVLLSSDLWLLSMISPGVCGESRWHNQRRYTVASWWQQRWKNIHVLQGTLLRFLLLCFCGSLIICIQLATGSVPQTLTSMKELDTVIQLKGKTAESEEKSVKIVDFPGHPRLRG